MLVACHFGVSAIRAWFKILLPLGGRWICLGDKALSLGGEGSELSGMGAARTASCVRQQVASRRYLMINIWRGGEWVEDQLDDPIPLHVILYLERTSHLSHHHLLATMKPLNPSGAVQACPSHSRTLLPWRQGCPDPARNAKQIRRSSGPKRKMTLVDRQNKIIDRR